MKSFKITTTVTSYKTIDYCVEAESLEEAIDAVRQGEERGEGEEVEDNIDWGTEIIDTSEEIEDFGEQE
jgi:hypothetical protein